MINWKAVFPLCTVCKLLLLLSSSCPVVSDSLQPHGLAGHHPSLSTTSSQSLPKFMSIALVMLSTHLILWHPLLLLPSIFPSIRDFSNELALCIDDQNTGTSASPSILPASIQGWFPLKSTCLISLLSKNFHESSPEPQFEDINSLTFCLLCGPSLTTVRDQWEDHSLDYTDLSRQNKIFAFQYTADVCHSFPANKQSFSDFMAAVTNHSDFRAQEEEICHYFHFPPF